LAEHYIAGKKVGIGKPERGTGPPKAAACMC